MLCHETNFTYFFIKRTVSPDLVMNLTHARKVDEKFSDFFVPALRETFLKVDAHEVKTEIKFKFNGALQECKFIGWSAAFIYCGFPSKN
jgi:hypothetical protein